MPRRSSNHDADRLQRALEGAPLLADRELRQSLAVAQALAPSVKPREAFRAALHDKLRRDFVGAPRQAPMLPTEQGDTGEVPMHRLAVNDPNLGRVTLADLETIDPARVQSITRRLAAIAARERVE